MDDFELLAQLGIEVVEVRRMPSQMRFVEDQNVALLRAGQAPSVRREAGVWLLSEALRLGASSAS